MDCEDLPAKPYVQKLTSAADVISATQELFGVNKRLEKAMADYKANEEKVKADGGLVASAQPLPLVKEGLRGLPPALLEKVLAREKAKQIRYPHNYVSRYTELFDRGCVKFVPDVPRLLCCGCLDTA